MLVTQLLAESKELISDPNHWTKERLARDDIGHPVLPSDERACRWCIIGALYHVAGKYGLHGDTLQEAIDAMEEATGDSIISVYNDRHNHEEVLELFDKAIGNLKNHE